MSVIVYKSNNNVSFIVPSKDTNDIKSLLHLVPPNAEYAIIERDKLPSDPYFRSAWELSNGDVFVDVEKAKDIQRDHWRTLRKPKLELLDLAYMRALESGDNALQADIVKQKNALRGVTSTSLPDDLEGIKSTIPSILL